MCCYRLNEVQLSGLEGSVSRPKTNLAACGPSSRLRTSDVVERAQSHAALPPGDKERHHRLRLFLASLALFSSLLLARCVVWPGLEGECRAKGSGTRDFKGRSQGGNRPARAARAAQKDGASEGRHPAARQQGGRRGAAEKNQTRFQGFCRSFVTLIRMRLL